MLIGLRHTYSNTNLKWRALIVSIRLLIAAVLAASVSVTYPAFVSAEDTPPPTVVEQQPGVTVVDTAPPQVERGYFDRAKDFVFGKAGEVKDTAVNKYKNFTDPDHKIADLTQRNNKLILERDDLLKQLHEKDERKMIMSSDRDTMQRCVRELNTLFSTGRMDHLFVEIPDEDPQASGPPTTSPQ